MNFGATAREFDARRFAADFHRDGYAVWDDVISLDEAESLRVAIDSLSDEVESAEGAESSSSRARLRDERSGGVYGMRNLLELCPAVRSLAVNQPVRRFAAAILGDDVAAVRTLYFDKTAATNWSLPWHRDTSIAVNQRQDVAGFSAWTRKAGVWHVRPPLDVLARMVTVRVHLDDCGPDQGPLRVIPGSHRYRGADDIASWEASAMPQVVCTVRCGGVVVMSPLTYHASSAVVGAGHRRVVHIEYANSELPGGLEWYQFLSPKR